MWHAMGAATAAPAPFADFVGGCRRQSPSVHPCQPADAHVAVCAPEHVSLHRDQSAEAAGIFRVAERRQPSEAGLADLLAPGNDQEEAALAAIRADLSTVEEDPV